MIPCGQEILRAEIEATIDTVDLAWFLSMFPAVDQGEYNFETPPLDCGKPEYHWIFRNVDFKEWDVGDSSRILWLSGPPECHMRKAASSILYQEMDKASKTSRLVFHFFCSATVEKESSVAFFIREIVQQIISSSPEAKQISIIHIFLRSILSDIFKKLTTNQMLRFSSNNSNSNIRHLLGAPDDSLWAALWAIMPTEQSPELSIIIDGIERVRDRRSEFIQGIRAFVEDLQRTSKAKILLTSGLESDTTEIFNGLPHIEFDKERKGLPATRTPLQH